MNLIDRLAIFDDRIKQDKKAKEEVVQYRVESIAFNDVFTGLQKNNGYLTKPKFIEMGIEWCSQTGYTQDEMLTRLKNLELDRDYLVNVLGLTTVPEKKPRERTYMAAYIMNTIRHLEDRKPLRVPHSGFIALDFDSDGDIPWTRFEAQMEQFRLENDVWYLLKKLYPTEAALVNIIDADSNPSPPMREIIKKRMEE